MSSWRPVTEARPRLLLRVSRRRVGSPTPLSVSAGTLIRNRRVQNSPATALEKCREATEVRREFVKTLLARKTAPKGWQYFAVHAITHHPEIVSGYEGKVAADMIGAKTAEDEKRGWNPLRAPAADRRSRSSYRLTWLPRLRLTTPRAANSARLKPTRISFCRGKTESPYEQQVFP
jgi:hypothetical protein